MKQKLFLALLLFVTSSFLYAQSLENWTWDTYKMKFKAPVDFKVQQNDAEKFSAGNGKLHLTIYPRKGENLEYSAMEAALRTWARSNNISFEGGVKYMKSLNDYWGCYIDGQADNGLPTSLLILVDPDYSEYSFYVWLQYQTTYFDTAVDILKSFVPY